MLYALLGIPMTLILLTAAVERVLVPVNGLLRWMHGAMGNRYQPIYICIMHFALVSRDEIASVRAAFLW